MSDVIVYSTNTCPYCTLAKQYLTEKGVEFKEVNVQEDQAAMEVMVSKSDQMGVPQIEVDGKMIIGFNAAAIDEALKA